MIINNKKRIVIKQKLQHQIKITSNLKIYIIFKTKEKN